MVRIAGVQFGGHVDAVIPELRAMWGYYRDRRPDVYVPLVEKLPFEA